MNCFLKLYNLNANANPNANLNDNKYGREDKEGTKLQEL